MYAIAVIEDDTDIRAELELLLTNALYRVYPILNFAAADQEIQKCSPDLVLLDINLPGTSGMEICRKVRSFSKVPIIFVTSRNTSADELNGIMLGGDDYITKPYHVPILLARIAAILKRTGKEDGEKDRMTVSCRGCVLNLLDSTLSCGADKVDLTRNELRICYHLFRNQGKIVPRMDLIEYLWEDQIFIDDNTLSVNMTRIRSKLNELDAKDLIETKRGQGYKV